MPRFAYHEACKPVATKSTSATWKDGATWTPCRVEADRELNGPESSQSASTRGPGSHGACRARRPLKAGITKDHDDPTLSFHESLFYCVANIPCAVTVTSTRTLTNAPPLHDRRRRQWVEACAECRPGSHQRIDGACRSASLARALNLPLHPPKDLSAAARRVADFRGAGHREPWKHSIAVAGPSALPRA